MLITTIMSCSFKNHVQDDARQGFTLAEVLIALAVTALFGLASFATNERLLVALKTQKETTAATMMLQERMEAFRSLLYSNIGSSTQSGTTNPPTTAADIVANATTSEGQLGGLANLTETITVSGYMDTSGTVANGSSKNVWVRDSGHPTGNQTSTYSTLATGFDLLKVDIQVTWTTNGGRSRTRTFSSIFGKGNRGS